MNSILWLTCFGLLVMIVAVVVLWKGFSDMMVDVISFIEKIRKRSNR
tara:strand:+ start:1609 stop:1749 length:141 start_codon:yes stop_codon:yes gene_type:complete